MARGDRRSASGCASSFVETCGGDLRFHFSSLTSTPADQNAAEQGQQRQTLTGQPAKIPAHTGSPV